jgi:L-glyceraldehyde 3-phosphate reductase
LEETMGALATAVTSGKALYVGISNYDYQQTEQAKQILDSMGVPLLIHQPKYSMLVRTPENGLFDTIGRLGIGSIVFSPLAQGLLTDRYLDGKVPKKSRAAKSQHLSDQKLSQEYLVAVNQLNQIAANRGQTLAQLALSWVLRLPTVTSALIGASSVSQLEQNHAAINAPALTQGEISEIDLIAKQGLG